MAPSRSGSRARARTPFDNLVTQSAAQPMDVEPQVTAAPIVKVHKPPPPSKKVLQTIGNQNVE